MNPAPRSVCPGCARRGRGGQDEFEAGGPCEGCIHEACGCLGTRLGESRKNHRCGAKGNTRPLQRDQRPSRTRDLGRWVISVHPALPSVRPVRFRCISASLRFLAGRTGKASESRAWSSCFKCLVPWRLSAGMRGPAFQASFFLTPSHLVSALWGSKRVCLSTRELLKPAISREFLSQQLQGGLAAPISGKNKGPLRGPF